MARELRDKPAELWMAEVTTTNKSNGFKIVERFGPFTRRGDAVGAAMRAGRRGDTYEQKREYFATDCEWKTRL